jgi:hypothetical protein
MAPRASDAVSARAPSPFRVVRDASVMRVELRLDDTAYSAAAITTTRVRRGSMNDMTTTRTTRVMMFPTRGSPAVTATSCSRPMSLTSRCTTSPDDAVEW